MALPPSATVADLPWAVSYILVEMLSAHTDELIGDFVARLIVHVEADVVGRIRSVIMSYFLSSRAVTVTRTRSPADRKEASGRSARRPAKTSPNLELKHTGWQKESPE